MPGRRQYHLWCLNSGPIDASVAKCCHSRGAFRSVCGGRPLDLCLRRQNALDVGDNFCSGDTAVLSDLFCDGYARLVNHAKGVDDEVFLCRKGSILQVDAVMVLVSIFFAHTAGLVASSCEGSLPHIWMHHCQAHQFNIL